MVKSKKKPVEIKTALGQREHKPRYALALVLLTLGVLIFAALFDYDAANNPYVNSDIARGQSERSQNMVGAFGTHVGFQCFRWLGVVAWVLPVLYWRWSFLCIYQKAMFLKWSRVLAGLALLLALTGLAAMAQQRFFEADPLNHAAAAYGVDPTNPFARYSAGSGGVVGSFLYFELMRGAVGPFGSGLLYAVSALALLLPVCLSEPRKVWQALRERVSAWWAKRREAAAKAAAERKERKEVEREAKRILKEEEAARKAKEAEDAAEALAKMEVKEAEARQKAEEEQKLRKAAEAKAEEAENFAKAAGKVALESRANEEAAQEAEAAKPKSAKPEAKPVEVESEAKKSAALRVFEGEVVEKATQPLVESKGKYRFPSLKLLQESPPKSNTHENYEETAEALVRTLQQFRVEVELGEVHSGPVITRYEVVPAPGVRVNKIEALDKDLALGLKAQSVRILAPVPGKGTVGIEVPNAQPQPVCLRDIIESRAWADSKADIPIVLGKEVTGKPVVMDLTKAPHMLIAGSTGSGKSVCINSLIASLLYKMSPADLRFIMVDPKVVELKMYNDLPHMLVPVVTDPKKVPGALKYLIKEMEYRFQIFAESNVRNIAGFNAKLAKDKEAAARAEEMESELSAEERTAMNNIEVPRDTGLDMPTEKLPYIVCIIDELADLMMVAPADIEHCIMRLTQLARAAGIHVILATQRPSVNVITGVIKSNIPMRIAFKVASNTDSRTILDGKGAESLIGKGDMLFSGGMNLTRAQGAFVSDEEIGQLVAFVREQNGPPIFDEAVQKQIESEGEEGGEGGGADAEGEWDDPLVPQAIDVIRNSKRASTSMLQRRLKIGYNRAARIMEILEDEGIVGPENGSSPREILDDSGEF